MLSVARIQAYLGVTGQNDYLVELEAAAVADVERLTGLYFGTVKAFTEVCSIKPQRDGLTRSERAPGPQSVRLTQPVASLAASTFVVSERGAPGIAWETVSKQTTDPTPADVFELIPFRLYRIIGQWPYGDRTVRVAYEHGYTVDQAPAAANGVVLDLIKFRYAAPELRGLPGNITSASIRGASMGFAKAGDNSMPGELMQRIMALRPAGSFS